MRRHADELLFSIRSDRRRGLSIPELVEKYSLPKTTIWHHTKDVVLPEHLQTFIRSKQGGSAKRSHHRWGIAQTKALSLLKNYNREMLWPVLIAALYWSEGTKKGGFVFTNTDEQMVRVFLRILREKLDVKNKDLDNTINLLKSSGHSFPSASSE